MASCVDNQLINLDYRITQFQFAASMCSRRDFFRGFLMTDKLWGEFKDFLLYASNPENFPEDPQSLFPEETILLDSLSAYKVKRQEMFERVNFCLKVMESNSDDSKILKAAEFCRETGLFGLLYRRTTLLTLTGIISMLSSALAIFTPSIYRTKYCFDFCF